MDASKDLENALLNWQKVMTEIQETNTRILKTIANIVRAHDVRLDNLERTSGK